MRCLPGHQPAACWRHALYPRKMTAALGEPAGRDTYASQAVQARSLAAALARGSQQLHIFCVTLVTLMRHTRTLKSLSSAHVLRVGLVQCPLPLQRLPDCHHSTVNETMTSTQSQILLLGGMGTRACHRAAAPCGTKVKCQGPTALPLTPHTPDYQGPQGVMLCGSPLHSSAWMK